MRFSTTAANPTPLPPRRQAAATARCDVARGIAAVHAPARRWPRVPAGAIGRRGTETTDGRDGVTVTEGAERVEERRPQKVLGGDRAGGALEKAQGEPLDRRQLAARWTPRGGRSQPQIIHYWS